jgi:hypothetical protein
MVYNTKNYKVSGLCTSFRILNTRKTQRFRKLDLFPKRCVFKYLKFRAMDKVQNPRNSERHFSKGKLYD